MRAPEHAGARPDKPGSPSRRAIRRTRPVLTALLGLALAAPLTGCTLWTVQSLHPAAGAAGAGSAVPGQPGFSAAAYANSIWQSQVVPTVQSQATDLPALLAALKADPAGAATKYGHREGSRPVNFLVKGSGKILTVDTTSRTGIAAVDLAPGDGKPDANIQIGPVIRGTSLRDALPFIQFNMFTNQLDYADVSNQLNDHVLKDTLAGIDAASLQGKTADFTGAFTQDPAGAILITPVTLQVK